ncbi:class I SAM-dependent methyltransferase [Pseudokineococcus basanitobsidens]|uniref:Class I SAM-dependent methyltransferase n=1 Tax=Pseudokineococcus basanitobsidens TaxID=1926649 RepID=A0ABU8RH13_9ACTN
MTAVFEVMSAVGAAPWEGSGRQGVDLLDAAPTGGPGDGLRAARGRALDVGCGTGEDAAELARRGFAVTGVDDVARSLRRARRRADDEGVDVHLVHGDVGDLRALDLGDDGEGFTAVLDVGCLHGMPPQGRAALGRGLDAVTSPGALLALLAWSPARRPPPLPRGVGRADLEAALPSWSLQHVEPADPGLVPRWLHRTRPTWYALERR